MRRGLRRQLDGVIGWLCRLVLGIYFRRIEIVGHDRLPEPPFLVVANHVNGLIDPLLVLGPLRVPARILGKNTLWKIPVLAQLLDLAGVIPVYRRQDANSDPNRNRESLARAAEELEKGGIVAIFPEGISHDFSHLAPLRTGAARVALEVAERRGRPLAVVPVGLLFEARDRFRSRALIVVGDVLQVESKSSEEAGGSVREVTRWIEAELKKVTVNYPTWEVARMIELGAEILARPTEQLPTPRTLAEGITLRKLLLAGFERLRAAEPERMARAAQAIRHYQETLRALALEDRQVVPGWPVASVIRFLWRILLRLVLALPLALLGSGIHLIPYGLVHTISRMVRNQRDQIATYQVFSSLVIYPLAWVAWGFVIARATGRWVWGVLAAIVAPVLGYVALRAHERWMGLVRETRAFLLLGWRRGAREALFSRRREVERLMSELIEAWRSLPLEEGLPQPVQR